MQEQRGTLESFTETVDLNQGAFTNNTTMDQSTAWNNMLHPVESCLSNYALSSSEGNLSCAHPLTYNVRNSSGMDLGESSSRENMRDQFPGDDYEMEDAWSSSFSVRGVVDTRFEDQKFEPSNIYLHDSANSGPGSKQIMGGPLSMQCSGPNRIPLDISLNAGYKGMGDDSGQIMRMGACPNFFKSGRSDKEHICSAGGSGDVGTSSGSAGYLIENDGGSGSSLGTWGLSCKRKAVEGTSGQFHAGSSSSCFPQAENIVHHTFPPRHSVSSSLNISSVPVNSSINHTEPLYARMVGGMRGVASDVFPPNAAGLPESTSRNFGVRVNPGLQDSIPLNSSMTGNTMRSYSICSMQQSARHMPFSDSMDYRPSALVPTNSSNPPNQSHLMHFPGFPSNMHTFPWNGAPNSRAGSSSSSLTLPDEAFRSPLRNNPEHPMFVSQTETRNLVQDATGWSLATGILSTSGGVPSSSRISPGSAACPLPTIWIPHHNPPSQSQQRMPEFAPWTLFLPVELESGAQRRDFSVFHSTPPSSGGTVMSSAAGSHGHHRSYPGSQLLRGAPGDDVSRWHRYLAADTEGRQRIVSEIRQVLNAIRRGENLQAEGYMLFDPFINGVAELHDWHGDMRLDVDNMSYEELLALEERIGNVSTGLSEETIFKTMRQSKYLAINIGSQSNLEPCCICQEEYVGGDDIGTLDCGHDFHTTCIKQWLTLKNLCPICKMTALNT